MDCSFRHSVSGTCVAKALQHFDILFCKIALRFETSIRVTEPGINLLPVCAEVGDFYAAVRQLPGLRKIITQPVYLESVLASLFNHFDVTQDEPHF